MKEWGWPHVLQTGMALPLTLFQFPAEGLSLGCCALGCVTARN